MIDIHCGPSLHRLIGSLEKIKPDVVHFHESWGHGSRRYPLPTVFTVHGFDSLNLPTQRNRFWRARSILWRLSEKLGLSRQTHIISIAPYVSRELRPRISAPLTEIWNSLSSSAFLARQEAPSSKEILFLGWLNHRKNPIALVEAVARIIEKHPDLELSLCGDGKDLSYSTALKRRISELGLRNVVELPGRIGQDEVLKRLRTARCLVLPSLQENAPMVVAEAMAAGVPVLGSNLCGIPDMIRHGQDGLLFDPGKINDIAKALDSVLSSQTYSTDLGRSAANSAKEKFHPSSVADQTIAVYKKAIASFHDQN